MFDTEFHRVLQKRAEECQPSEFKDLIDKYGHNDTCVQTLQKAVTACGRREDSGDWTSSASPGWQKYSTKRKMLDQLYLDRGPGGDFKAAAQPPATNDDVAKLREDVRILRARVQRLEGTERQKFRLGTKP